MFSQVFISLHTLPYASGNPKNNGTFLGQELFVGFPRVLHRAADGVQPGPLTQPFFSSCCAVRREPCRAQTSPKCPSICLCIKS